MSTVHDSAGERATEALEEAADATVHGGGDAPSRAVELLGRVGLVAYGLVHVLLAGLTVRLALGASGIEADQQGAVHEVAGLGLLGQLLLVVFVAGLVAFAVWQGCAAAVGFRWVSGGERLRKRVGAVAKTIAVLAVAVAAVRTVIGDPTSGRAGPQLLVSSLLELPGGRALVWVAAAVVLIVAGTMVYTGLSRSFLGDLVDAVPPRVRRVAAALGLLGNLARAVAFGGVGVLLAVGGLRGDPRRVGGFDLALREMAAQWRGMAPLLVVAAGLAAFGVYCFVDARYRRAGVGTPAITRSRSRAVPGARDAAT